MERVEVPGDIYNIRTPDGFEEDSRKLLILEESSMAVYVDDNYEPKEKPESMTTAEEVVSKKFCLKGKGENIPSFIIFYRDNYLSFLHSL